MSAFNGAGLFLFLLMCVGIVCAFLIGGAEWEKHKQQSREGRYYDRATTTRPGGFDVARRFLHERPVDLDEEDRGHYKPRDIR